MRRFSLSLVSFFIAFAVIYTFGFVAVESCSAQRSSRLPDDRHYNNAVFFREFYQGDYREALKRFQSGANGAYKKGTGTGVRRYLDSIVFWTMIGECNYHMGNYAQAVAMYDQSLSLYMSYQRENWQTRIKLPPTIPLSSNAIQQANINWGKSIRNIKVANVPNTFQVLFGRLDSARAINEGGLLDNPELRRVDVTEIMRCVSICLHRRTTINGPIGKYDPFNAQLVTSLSTGGALGIVEVYNKVLKGLALSSFGELDRAQALLKTALTYKGMDHPLTPVALLEMAKIGLAKDDLVGAKAFALEASYSAAMFNQYDLVEESLSLGTKIHLVNSRTEFAPLKNAIVWANGSKARLMQASLIVRLAECYAEAGDAVSAAKVLNQVKVPINRRNSLPNAVVSARAKYVGAVIEYLKGNFGSGSEGLKNALAHFQTGSLWLYRLGLANKLIANGSIGQRQADQLYSRSCVIRRSWILSLTQWSRSRFWLHLMSLRCNCGLIFWPIEKITNGRWKWATWCVDIGSFRLFHWAGDSWRFAG